MRLVKLVAGRLTAGLPQSPLKASTPIRRYWYDPIDGGAGVIEGPVTVENVPTNIPRLIRLYRKDTGYLVRQIWSTTGAHYTFNNIAIGPEYFVVGHDPFRVYNADIADMLTAS